MAAGPATRISDIIIPEIFTPYTQLATEEKARLITSGALVRSSVLDEKLAGGGLLFEFPFFKDLDNDEERISTDTSSAMYSGGTADPDPKKITTAQQTAVRLERNQSWSSVQLAADLAGADPLQAIQNRVASYWTRRLQAAFVATMKGVFADNAAAPSASEHVQNDMTTDISGASFVDGITNFNSESFIDATLTMGDSMEDLTMLMVHSVVYGRMQKNNLIDFIPDARGETQIPVFLGRPVIVDDSMPVTSGVFESWLFGAGAVSYGVGSPEVPTEVQRHPGAGNGAGQETLYNRVRWSIHPNGLRYVGTTSGGGPSNAATSNNLAHAGSWQRVAPERKQIKIARLITREY